MLGGVGVYPESRICLPESRSILPEGLVGEWVLNKGPDVFVYIPTGSLAKTVKQVKCLVDTLHSGLSCWCCLGRAGKEQDKTKDLTVI